MTNNATVDVRKIVHTRTALEKYRDSMYLQMMNSLNTQTQEILKDDLGSQFVTSCGRDLAGEVVRNFFNTQDYHITVDQLAIRIMNFSYENEYDPLNEDSQIHKNVYNYNQLDSPTVNAIVKDMDNSQKRLFEKGRNEAGQNVYKDREMIQEEKNKYVEMMRAADGTLYDTFVGNEGEYIIDKHGNRRRRLQVEHTQALNAATYNERFIKEKGINELKKVYNSENNFTLMLDTANQIKSDVRVCINKDNKVEYMNSSKLKSEQQKGRQLEDITHRATPEQYAAAVVHSFENVKNAETRQKLIDNGYLGKDGKVPKHIKNKLIQQMRQSQNAEGKAILRNVDYGEVGKEAWGRAKQSLGKIVAGQIIYYAAPPIIYEIKSIMKSKPSSLEKVIEKLDKAKKRVIAYLVAHLKDIFKNVAVNAIKNFLRIFLDIVINLVKATIKRIIRLVKSLVLATVDAIKILVKKGASPAEKADAVCNLFGVTLTTFVVDVLFGALSAGLHIPDFLLMPLQILTTVVCTNLTLLILQKADLFDIRYGFKIQAMRKLFDESVAKFNEDMSNAEKHSEKRINAIIEQARSECVQIYNNIKEQSPYEVDLKTELDKINKMFGMGIDFDEEWHKFIGIEPMLA